MTTSAPRPTKEVTKLERYSELKNKMDSYGKGGFVKLTTEERVEYKELNDEFANEQRLLPREFVLDCLDQLYKLIGDGNHRKEILRLKREVQTYHDEVYQDEEESNQDDDGL